MTEEQVVERLRSTVPSCLRGFRVTPAHLPEPFDDNPCSVWQISCPCGGKKGRFLGHSLKDHNANYAGPECYISPLAFECHHCKKSTELLDTDPGTATMLKLPFVEMAGSDSGQATEAKDLPQAFVCPSCGGKLFSVTIGFVFWNPDELAEDPDPHCEELFSVFLCYCKCAACEQTSQPTDFGKL